MAAGKRRVASLVLLMIIWWSIVSAAESQCEERNDYSRKRPSHKPFTSHQNKQDRSCSSPLPSESCSTSAITPSDSAVRDTSLSRRGLPGMPGDIEWMGFYGSLLAVPTMLSILGIITNYNLGKSYYNSELNAQYYKQSREMLRAHTAKLIQDQEKKFANAGVSWNGMVYGKDGQVNPGAKLPEWNGRVLGGTVADPKSQPVPGSGGAVQGAAAGVGGGTTAGVAAGAGAASAGTGPAQVGGATAGGAGAEAQTGTGATATGTGTGGAGDAGGSAPVSSGAEQGDAEAGDEARGSEERGDDGTEDRRGGQSEGDDDSDSDGNDGGDAGDAGDA